LNFRRCNEMPAYLVAGNHQTPSHDSDANRDIGLEASLFQAAAMQAYPKRFGIVVLIEGHGEPLCCIYYRRVAVSRRIALSHIDYSV